MEDAKNVFRIVGMILLGLFILAVGIPLVFAAAGIALISIVKLVHLAIFLIKIAVFVAVLYLILAGVRALLNR